MERNSKNVWVFAELREGKLAPVVIELLGEGKKLSDGLGQKLCAVLLSDGSDASLCAQLGGYGADIVYSVESPLLAHYTTGNRPLWGYARWSRPCAACFRTHQHRSYGGLYGTGP